MTTGTIDINTLPVIEELFGDDFVLVQAKGRTALIPFDDFVIGEQQVSFYKEIVDARNTITALTKRVDEVDSKVDGNVETITANTDSVTEVEANSANITSALGQTAIEISLLTNKVNELDSTIAVRDSEMSTVQASLSSIETSTDVTAVSTLQATVLAQQDLIASLQADITSMQSTVNSITPQLFVVNSRIDTLEGG